MIWGTERSTGFFPVKEVRKGKIRGDTTGKISRFHNKLLRTKGENVKRENIFNRNREERGKTNEPKRILFF